ncbi:MAG TPA: LuxR C-terminal-related transcriptional regulator [Candidatus Elarobacter sp.]|jgi:DNA-binding CsgD family transcriptional regulator|nr:LuxR C-terminal-related transcriptional regulator [Candidatus Elarobacter sp.]
MIRAMHGCSRPMEVGLSPRERDVLDGFVAGKSDTQIASMIGRSVHTVRTIARNIRAKFLDIKMEELVAGVRRGDYRIRRSEDRFNLHSAVAAIERALREMQRRQARSPRRNPRFSVRFHELEAEALLRIGHAVLGAEDEVQRGNPLQPCGRPR